MDSQTVRDLLFKHFPELSINELNKMGEGTGNVAYEVNNDLIFRFPKEPENQEQLEQEISVQEVLELYSTLPFPRFIYLPYDHSFVGYKKLSGISLLRMRNEFNAWDIFAKEIGSFLGRLHSIPREELNSLSVLKEGRSHEKWRELGRSFFERTRNVIPKEYASQIENFFNAHIPRETEDFVLCHNDLGIEHILIKNGEVSGIIDWGGVALADPACDFARIYRDVGVEITDSLIREYTNTQFDKAELRERTIFIGRCLFFEDLFYGVEQEEYLQKSLDVLKSMF